MNRRLFLRSSLQGATLFALPTLTGCAVDRADDGEWTSVTSPPLEVEFDPGPYSVDDRWLVFDDDGIAFALDPEEHTVYSVDDAGKASEHFANDGLMPDDLNHPSDGVVGPDGHLYLLDRGNFRVQVLDGDGRVVRTFGERELIGPTDLALHAGSVYVCDAVGHKVVRYSQAGDVQQTFTRAADGEFNGPRSVAIDLDGDVHVLDAGHSLVVVLAADGRVIGSYGGYGDEPGAFLMPTSVACNRKGRSFVSDMASGYVSVFEGTGAFLGRFRPRDASGHVVTPERVTVLADDTLHISTGGHAAFSEG